MVIPEQDERGIVREVVKHGAAVLKEQGQVVLRAAGYAASADFGEGGAEIGVTIKTLKPCHLETVGCITADRELPGGHQFDLLDAVNGALIFRVKGPQGFDLVIEQVDAIRRITAHWEYI